MFWPLRTTDMKAISQDLLTELEALITQHPVLVVILIQHQVLLGEVDYLEQLFMEEVEEATQLQR